MGKVLFISWAIGQLMYKSRDTSKLERHILVDNQRELTWRKSKDSVWEKWNICILNIIRHISSEHNF